MTTENENVNPPENTSLSESELRTLVGSEVDSRVKPLHEKLDNIKTPDLAAFKAEILTDIAGLFGKNKAPDNSESILAKVSEMLDAKLAGIGGRPTRQPKLKIFG